MKTAHRFAPIADRPLTSDGEPFRVLVTDDIGQAGLQHLQARTHLEVRSDLEEDALIAHIGGRDALVVRSRTRVTQRVIEAADRLRVIVRAGVGTDNIDLDAATRAGILVINTPDSSVRATAEHTIAMLLALCRNIPQAHASVVRGEWQRERFVGTEIYGKTLGVVGLGRIGGQVARLAGALGMRVIAHDPYVTEDRAAQSGATLVPLDRLWAESDFITLHLPLNTQTRGTIDRHVLWNIKPGVRIVNCARGGLIDEAALHEALEDGRVAGAALDVFESEPPLDRRLIDHPRVIATPHLGASTREAQEAIGLDAAEQLLQALEGRLPRGTVNVAALRPEAWERLAPHLELARVLGALARQLGPGPAEVVEVRLEGELASAEPSLLTSSVLAGLLGGVTAQTVNLVNAPLVASERGLRVVESRQDSSDDFASLMVVTARTGVGELSLAGTLFGHREPRIVRIGEYRIDLAPAAHMLFAWNTDRPGMIGRVGTILGRFGVNIAGMHLGRQNPGGVAVMVLTLDDPVPAAAVAEIQSVDGIYDVKVAQL
ncbi:MAG: phosphoglycerate dehydrogenase [Armatimonadota bacterium]|nr:phosphoglycerate dehydrogenase [Armatimonadota bacterium]MDR5696712.1 phosphoglycerate dehydrogenase [Armatimonadota bacterium]